MEGSNTFIKKSVRALKPYIVENTEASFKLDAMENPYPLPDSLRDLMLNRIKEIAINRYPDPDAGKLKEIYSRKTGVKSKNLIIGNGSDELIQLILTAAAEPGGKVLFPVPTFSMYGIIARPLNLSCVEVPLEASSWRLDEEKFLAAIKEESPSVIFISNPNNPTGNCFSENTLIEIISSSPGLVVIDEAYFSFSGRTLISRIEKHKNLVILRTLSKIGLAGLRVGIMISRESICTEIGKVRLPYNTNSISQAIAEIVLEQDFEITKQIEKIVEDRELLYNEIVRLPGITPFRSDTNFILFRSKFPASKIFRALLAKGILIRHFGDSGMLKDCLRVTVGTGHENRVFLEALKEITVEHEKERYI